MLFHANKNTEMLRNDRFFTNKNMTIKNVEDLRVYLRPTSDHLKHKTTEKVLRR